MKLYLLLISLLLIIVSFTGCKDSPISPDTSDRELQQIIDEGLEAWRKPGAIQKGAACANCHAPDALDLAYFDFSDKTLKRRAKPHVSQFSSQLTAIAKKRVIFRDSLIAQNRICIMDFSNHNFKDSSVDVDF